MAKIAMRVDIAAPIQEVFDYVADYRNALHYMANFQSFRPLTPKTYGFGAKVLASGRLHGIPIYAELEIVGFEKNHRLVSVSRRGVGSTSEWTFEPFNGGTRVTFVADYSLPHLPFASLLLNRMVEAGIRDGTRRTIENLKWVLEQGQNGKSLSADA